MSYLSAAIIGFPNEVYQHIFIYLDTQDLLTLRFVCTGFREHALVLLINRHRGFLQRHLDYLYAVAVSEDNLDHDSATVRLGKDALDVSIMHCIFSLGQISDVDFIVLKQFIILSQNLVHFRFDKPPNLEGESEATRLRFVRGLLLAFAGSRSHPRVPSILVLNPSYGFVRSSSRSSGYPNADIHGAEDPAATEIQKAQIMRDLEHILSTTEIKNFHMYTLELPPTFARHILVVQNHQDIERLDISTEVVPQGMWENLLQYADLPALTAVCVQQDLNFPMSALTQFLWRHPKVTQLALKQGSISRPMAEWPPLEHLHELEAPVWFVEYILQRVDLGVLQALRIGGAMSMALGEPAEVLRYEGGFDFEILDDVLRGLANSSVTVVEIMIPGRSASKTWLSDSVEDGEPCILNVERVHVYTDYAFTSEVFDLLKVWIRLKFPEMEYTEMSGGRGVVAQNSTTQLGMHWF